MKRLVVLVLAVSLFGGEVYAQGVTREVWVGKTLANPGDLIINPNILGTPTTIETLTTGKFSSTNVQGPFVARYTAKLNVPVTGNYPFFFTASGESAVWINTTTNFSQLTSGMGLLGSVLLSTPVTITQWTKYAGQKSAKIPLVKGATYFLQAIQVEKDTDKVNHLAVGWQLATGLYERPIPSSRLTAVIPDYTGPAVAITSLIPGQLVSGTTSVWTLAADTAGVTGVRFQVDGVNVGSEVTVPPFSLDLDTRLYSNGQHTVTVLVRDANGNVTVKSVVITVANVLVPSPMLTGIVTNPRTIEFEPSPDHFRLDNNGNPVILSYRIGFYAVGAMSPVMAWNFTKPALQADGRIRYGVSSSSQYYMIPLGGIYEVRVGNVTANGVSGVSEPSSNQCTIVR